MCALYALSAAQDTSQHVRAALASVISAVTSPPPPVLPSIASVPAVPAPTGPEGRHERTAVLAAEVRPIAHVPRLAACHR